MTEELQTFESSEPTCLLDHPQKFGLLPTKWFWKHDENMRHVRLPVGILTWVVFSVIAGFTNWPLAVKAVVPVIVMTLSIGLLERYIRRRAKARRAMLDTSTMEMSLSAGDAGSDEHKL